MYWGTVRLYHQKEYMFYILDTKKKNRKNKYTRKKDAQKQKTEERNIRLSKTPPFASEYFPAVQLMQSSEEVDPTVLEYFPAGQFEQLQFTKQLSEVEKTSQVAYWPATQSEMELADWILVPLNDDLL
jgi:hypothetical protein